jgi:hypothetical protein
MVDGDGADAELDRAVRRSDEILSLLFAAERRGLAGKRLERLRTAEADLRSCLNALADRLLTDHELVLLELERQLDPVGAVERVAAAGVVLLVLPRWLRDERWRGEDLEDRRLRIRVAEDLSAALIALPEVASAEWRCARREIESAVEDARSELRRARSSASSVS